MTIVSMTTMATIQVSKNPGRGLGNLLVKRLPQVMSRLGFRVSSFGFRERMQSTQTLAVGRRIKDRVNYRGLTIGSLHVPMNHPEPKRNVVSDVPIRMAR